MAITSTSFMAAPGGFSTTLSAKLDKIDMSQVLSAVLKADKQFLGHIKMGPSAHNIEVNWIEDLLNAAYVIASSSSSTTATVTSPSATASVQRLLRNNVVLMPNKGEIRVKVGATITKLTLTIAAYASTTWASWTATKCYIVAQPKADIDDASEDVSVIRTKKKNYTQVFERAIQITESRQGMDMEAVTNELQLQTGRRTMEIKRELDMSVINGYAIAGGSTNYVGDDELRCMAGITQLIRDPNLDTTNEDTTVIQASAALTVGHINSLAYKIYDEGGLDEGADPIILVGPDQQRNIAAFEKELRRVEQGERQVGYYRDVFMSDMGVEMPVVLDRWVPNDKLFIIDRSRIALRALQGDGWHLNKMSKTGRSDKWQLSGQYTIELRNAAECHGMIYDLT